LKEHVKRVRIGTDRVILKLVELCLI
jgi:hypothetical protein